MDLTQLDATAIGEEIAAGKLDPVEVAEAFFEAIQKHPQGGEIYARTTQERALEEAGAARKRQQSGERLSVLDGVPVSWKDLYDTAGVATESGAAILKDRIPETDAVCLQHATKAGTVCLGKTHQTEFAFSGLGINPNTATPPNLDYPGCLPGGSSSGAAVSVRAGLAPIAIGSDTGGSVRIPACFNSLVGMKTTHGLISLEGAVALCRGFDTAGPLAKSVRDAAAMTSILSGGMMKPLEPASTAGLSFAIPEGEALRDCDEAQIEGFEAAVAALEKAGARITRLSIPTYTEAVGLGPTLFPYEAWKEWGEAISANPGKTYMPVEQRFRQGESVTEAQYLEAWEKLKEIRGRHADAVSGYDALLTPTVAIAPRPVAPLLEDAELFGATNLMALRNTRYVNMLGGCALTLPTPVKGAGLQIIGGPNEDARILAIGAGVEAETGLS